MSKKIVLFGSYEKVKQNKVQHSHALLFIKNIKGCISVPNELGVKNPSSTLSLFVSLPFDSSSQENKIIKRE